MVRPRGAAGSQALDAASRDWDREVECHRCTGERIKKLPADLGEPLDGLGNTPLRGPDTPSEEN